MPQDLRLPAGCRKDSAAGRAFGWYGSGEGGDPGSHWGRAGRFHPANAESSFVPGLNLQLPVKISSCHRQGQLLPILALQTPTICSRNTVAGGGLVARHQKSLLGCWAMHWGPPEDCCLLSISGLRGKHRVGLVAWQRACHGSVSGLGRENRSHLANAASELAVRGGTVNAGTLAPICVLPRGGPTEEQWLAVPPAPTPGATHLAHSPDGSCASRAADPPLEPRWASASQ